MKRTITIIILLSVIWLFATYNPNTLTAEIQHTDIIKYYQLYDKINALEANIDSLETKISVLEMVIEYEIFDKDSDIKTITKEVNDNYKDVMEDIILLWEAIYKLQDGR